jgi:FRG domain
VATTLSEQLPVLGRICHATYVLYKEHESPQQLAHGLAALLGPKTRVFTVKSDVLPQAHGRELVSALMNAPAVIVLGPAESQLVQQLAHCWPDYVENARHWSGTVINNVHLEPTDSNKLSAVYCLVPKRLSNSDRPCTYPLKEEEIQQLEADSQHTLVSIESLGIERRANYELSTRTLCLLHERDPRETPIRRHLGEIMRPVDEPLSWADLQVLLQYQPDRDLLDSLYESKRLNDEQYEFGMSAIEFINEEKLTCSRGGVYSDIYSAVWFLEPAFPPQTIFRGQGRVEWGLEPTLLRSGAAGLDVAELKRRLTITEDFLEELRKNQTEFFRLPLDEDSLLAIAQHFGFPTPLLDYTRSFRVSAFFASQAASVLNEKDEAIGVIYYHFRPPDDSFSGRGGDIRTSTPNLAQLAGMRVGTLRVITPNLMDSDNRIRRQQAVFVDGYRARDLQAVAIDRLYFRQHSGVVFEDPRNGISRENLLPEHTALSKLADEVRRRHKAIISTINVALGRTRLDDTSIVGSAEGHLFWHLRFGQDLLNRLADALENTSEHFRQMVPKVVTEYFAMARIEAEISMVPNAAESNTWEMPLHRAIAELEAASGLQSNSIWQLLETHLPTEFVSGGILDIQAPQAWSVTEQLAFTCSLFLVAWEHLRRVNGRRAQELVQTAVLHLSET